MGNDMLEELKKQIKANLEGRDMGFEREVAIYKVTDIIIEGTPKTSRPEYWVEGRVR